MKTLIVIALTAWASIVAHNHIIESDSKYYRFRKDSIDTVCAIHKFYNQFEVTA